MVNDTNVNKFLSIYEKYLYFGLVEQELKPIKLRLTKPTYREQCQNFVEMKT